MLPSLSLNLIKLNFSLLQVKNYEMVKMYLLQIEGISPLCNHATQRNRNCCKTIFRKKNFTQSAWNTHDVSGSTQGKCEETVGDT